MRSVFCFAFLFRLPAGRQRIHLLQRIAAGRPVTGFGDGPARFLVSMLSFCAAFPSLTPTSRCRTNAGPGKQVPARNPLSACHCLNYLLQPSRCAWQPRADPSKQAPKAVSEKWTAAGNFGRQSGRNISFVQKKRIPRRKSFRSRIRFHQDFSSPLSSSGPSHSASPRAKATLARIPV